MRDIVCVRACVRACTEIKHAAAGMCAHIAGYCEVPGREPATPLNLESQRSCHCGLSLRSCQERERSHAGSRGRRSEQWFR